VEPIDWTRYRKIVFLTGAGVSVASGLRAFRGPGGLWEERDLVELSDAAALARDPEGVWRLFGELRPLALAARPNAAHRALREVERLIAPGAQCTVITQNVDGLHQRAGSTGVIELHGSLFRTRCSSSGCDLEAYPDGEAHASSVPRCPRCGAVARPDVVLFNEALPVDAEWAAKKALRDCDLFIAAGTSGTVWPAASFVGSAEYEGARTILVNLEPMRPRNPHFHEEVLGKAEEVLPRLLGVEV